jgi:hypothetical protein
MNHYCIKTIQKETAPRKGLALILMRAKDSLKMKIAASK